MNTRQVVEHTMDHQELYARVKGLLEEPAMYGYFIRWASDGLPGTAFINLLPQHDGTVIATYGDNRMKIEPVTNEDGGRRVFPNEASACEWAWAEIQEARTPPATPTPEQTERALASGREQIEAFEQAKRAILEQASSGEDTAQFYPYPKSADDKHAHGSQ